MFFCDFPPAIIANEQPISSMQVVFGDIGPYDLNASLKNLAIEVENFYQEEANDILTILDQTSFNETVRRHYERAKVLQALIKEIRDSVNIRRLSFESGYQFITTYYQSYQREFEDAASELNRHLYPMVVEDENERMIMNHRIHLFKESLSHMAKSRYDYIKKWNSMGRRNH